MIRRSIGRMAALGLVGLLAAGCSGGGASTRGSGPGKTKGDRNRISQSEGVEPVWIQECPVHTDYVMAFCGESERQASQQAAYAAAYADALGKLRRFIGQKVEAKLEPDGQGGYRFEIQGVDDQAVTIRGAWEGERWCEEYEGPGGRTHDCDVMLSYPRNEYDALVGAAQKVARQKMTKAVELHHQGKDLAAAGRHAEAQTLFERAQGLLAQLREPQVVDGLTSDVLKEQVTADLRQASQAAREAGSTALVVVGLAIDGQLQTGGRELTNTQNTIQKWVVGHGIKIRPGGLDAAQVQAILTGDREAAQQAGASKGAGVLLVVDIRNDLKSQEGGAFYYYAEGGLRLVRTSDGRELYTAALPPTKAGHPRKNGALEKALDTILKNHVQAAVQAAVGKIR